LLGARDTNDFRHQRPSNCERFMAQSRRIPAGIPTRKSCSGAVAQKQQYGALAMPSNALQTLPRGVKLNQPQLKRLEPILVLGDDLLWRAGEEIVIAQL
jgi:hypothetical protein